MFLTAFMASYIAFTTELLFGAQATYIAACASIICDSGIPTRSTAWAHAVATTIACGSALPTSSHAQIIILLAINVTLSPA